MWRSLMFMERTKYRTTIWLLDVIFMFLGTPLIIILSIWSIFGGQIWGLNALSPNKMLLAIAAQCSALLSLLIVKKFYISRDIWNVLDSLKQHALSHTIVRRGKKASIGQVNLMLDEVKHYLKGGERVVIYEVNLEPKPPTNNGIIAEHKQLIEEAVRKDYNLEWEIIVGNINGEKSNWIGALRKEMEGEKYRVYELKDPKPSLNFCVIPSPFDQTYLGMGNWLGETSTGGIWIHNKHISDAMSMVFAKLSNLCEKETPGRK